MMWSPGTAWLFCPADRPDRYLKGLALADTVVLDLEDAVAPLSKAMAREAVRDLVREGRFESRRTVLRVNSASSPEHSADLELLREIGEAAPVVMLAKAESVTDLADLAGHSVIPLIESAWGVERSFEIAGADTVVAVMWGADDLVASLGGTASRLQDGRYRDIARFARSRVLLAAKCHARYAVDAVFMDISDLAGLRAECEDAVAVGFDATVAIHPSQVEVIRSAYRPDPVSVARARLLLESAGAGGVTTFEGRMIDGPIVLQAQRVLERAASTRNFSGANPNESATEESERS